MKTRDYRCPVCGTISEMVINDTQAFCTNKTTCNVLCFNPSLPDGGMNNPTYVDLNDVDFKDNE